MSQGFFFVQYNFTSENKTKSYLIMPKKKNIQYKGQIEKLPDKKIFINVNHLEKGDYELNIINKNKLIVKTKFNK